MSESDNIIGKTFGYLYVESETSKRRANGAILYKCICTCGKITYATKYNLTSGHKKSCGCIRKNAHTEDLTGSTFKNLLVLKKVENDKHRNALWLCKCICGNTVVVSTNALKSGNTKSCGCLINNESALKKDKVFGTSIGLIKRQELNKNNSSGHRGVSWDTRKNKWRAYIIFKGIYYHLLYTDNINIAISARKIAEEKLYGEFLEWYEQFKNDINNNKNNT